MSKNIFDKLQNTVRGNKVRIALDKSSVTVNGITFSSPIVTSVKYASEDTLDPKKGDEVDEIVHVRTIHLEPIAGDNTHDEYVIETRNPAIGKESVSTVIARDWYEGRVGDGKYTPSRVAGILDLTIV